MKNITTVLLAGGDSTRFWPLTDKLFVNFLGKPVLYYRLNQLAEIGLSDIVIIHGKDNKDLFLNFQKEYSQFKFKLIPQTDPRGMAGALLSAENIIKNKSIIILKPTDLFEDILLREFKETIQKNPENLLTGIAMKSYFPGGYLTVEGGRIKHIIEKPKEASIPSHIVRLVFDYFKDASIFLKFLKKAQSPKDDLYEVALENMITRGIKFNMLEYKGYWGYLQYPWHVLSLSSFFLSKVKGGKKRDVKVATSALIKGDVYLEEGVTILENAKIVGPTFIGRNTLVGNNTIIRESMIGENCVVGFGSEITRSYVGNNSWFHTNYIGDSVIGGNVGMGSGAVAANFRLDEKEILSAVGKKLNTYRTKLGTIVGDNVRIGVNASLMPGIKVGRNSFVGSGVVLDQDLADNQACFIKNGYTITPNTQTVVKSNRDTFKNKLKI